LIGDGVRPVLRPAPGGAGVGWGRFDHVYRLGDVSGGAAGAALVPRPVHVGVCDCVPARWDARAGARRTARRVRTAGAVRGVRGSAVHRGARGGDLAEGRPATTRTGADRAAADAGA